MLNIKERRVIVEPKKDLKEVSLDNNIPGRTTYIGRQANPLVCKYFAPFLKTTRDVFAWSHEDMLGISPSIMVHKLNVCPSVHQIR